MNTHPMRGERGSAMLAALCLAMVFAISLSSYIALCYSSVNLSARSLALEHGNELAEAGVEQALYALSAQDWTIWTISGTTATADLTMTSTGFVQTSTGPAALNFGNGTTGKVLITVTNYANFQTSTTTAVAGTAAPGITAKATMTMPSYMGGSSANTISSTAKYLSAGTVNSAATPVLVNAVASTTGTVRFRSAGTVDSFTSNPTGTTYQAYTSSVAGYSAVILSGDETTTSASVRLGNAVVHGYAVGYNYSSPTTTNWLSYSASGKIVGPNTPAATFIDSSRLLTDPAPYQPLAAESLPVNLDYPTLPSAASTDGSTFNKTAVIGSTTSTRPLVYNAGTGINLSNAILTVQGPVVIICYSDVVISGWGQIVLATPQASLQIFLEYGSLSLGGNGISNINLTPLPKKVAILSTTNLYGTASITTNMPYYGVVYFPYMPMTVTALTPTFYGALVGSGVSFTYSPTFHYDRALRSPMPGYSSASPLQSGAAFDNLSAPAAFSGLVMSSP